VIDMQRVLNAAKEASSVIMSVYHSKNYETQIKEDQSPVTTADLAASACIRQSLMQLAPDIPVLCEENTEVAKSKPTCFWCVDPLDGTKEFINKTGEFSINIALIKNAIPVLGVVWWPARQCGYAACATDRVVIYADEGGRFHNIRTRQWPCDTAIQLLSRHHPDSNAVKLCASNEPDCRQVPMGSALKGCLIAHGKADCYIRNGPTSWWDTAAFQCIVEVAGGVVFDADGNPLRYAWGKTMINPHFVVLGDAAQFSLFQSKIIRR
jgi:3'(2'), 5'-bisphosphate nucleotidase